MRITTQSKSLEYIAFASPSRTLSATAGETGFHHNFERANAQDAQKASALMQRLSAKQVAADPQMAAALAKLKSHVVHVGRMHNSSGVQRGVQTRGGKKSL